MTAMLQEWAQLGESDKRTFISQLVSKLTKEDKRNAVRVLSLVKKKRCGKFKGRVVADGRKQRPYIANESVDSPTVHLESLLTTLVIDGHDNRDLAIIDVGGAIILSKIAEFILIKVDGDDPISLINANPAYEKYVTVEHGKRVLYLKLRTALYGKIQAALLWYETYATCLKIMDSSCVNMIHALLRR